MKRVLLSMLLGAGAALAQAGVVEVGFMQPDRYHDAGRTARERDETQQALAGHLRQLGERLLPARQTLKIEVLDIDLAGELRPGPAGSDEIRVMRGGADWPRIALRYEWRDGDRLLSSGEERLADLDYLAHAATLPGRSGPLPYEKRLLERWFNERFAAPQ